MSEYDDLIEQGERERAEDLKVLETLQIPPHSPEGTYSERNITGHIVRSVGGHAIGLAGSMAISATDDEMNRVQVGDKIAIEWRGKGGLGSMVMGIVHDGQWIKEQTDEAHDEWVAKMQEDAKRQEDEYVAAHKDEWNSWLADLPEWLKTPAEAIRRDMGETMTWGYQLVAFRLAAMYVEIGDEILGKDVFSVPDTEEINAFAKEVGTTGNQHSLGLSFAQRHLEGAY